MPRVLGRVQRAILGYMVADRRRPWSAHELAGRILGSASTSAQFSIRRALANLGAAGTIAELPSDTAIKFWRLAANARHRPRARQPQAQRRKRRREKDLRQARLDKLAKMLGILGSDHEGHVLLGAGQADRQPIGHTLDR